MPVIVSIPPMKRVTGVLQKKAELSDHLDIPAKRLFEFYHRPRLATVPDKRTNAWMRLEKSTPNNIRAELSVFE